MLKGWLSGWSYLRVMEFSEAEATENSLGQGGHTLKRDCVPIFILFCILPMMQTAFVPPCIFTRMGCFIQVQSNEDNQS